MFKKGFSLVEIMIVVAIIGILVAALLPQLGEMIENARISNAERSLATLRDAIVRYNASEDRELESLSWLVPSYIQEIDPDPWGNDYIILPDDGVIISRGPSGEPTDEAISAVDINDPTNPINDATSLENLDNIQVFYKPRLQIQRARMTLDRTGNRRFGHQDRFTIYFTKPFADGTLSSISAGDTQQGTPVASGANTYFIISDTYGLEGASANSLNDAQTGIKNPLADRAGTGQELFLWGFDEDYNHDTSYTGYIESTTGESFPGSPDFEIVDISDDNTSITFEINLRANDYEIRRTDLYIRLNWDAINPVGDGDTAIFRDNRNVPAVQPDYNIPIETR
ncbi:MAG: type II secretion system protein [Candidatus Muiribacteriota bacterium]